MGSVVGFLIAVIYFALFVFFIVMVYRFVTAVEKIADKIDRGLTILKEENPR
jgi:uncharacterized membrane protein